MGISEQETNNISKLMNEHVKTMIKSINIFYDIVATYCQIIYEYLSIFQDKIYLIGLPPVP